MKEGGGFSFIDLFAGAGGFALGLVKVGASVSGVAVDADPYCAETLATNVPQAQVVCSDVRKVSFEGPVDVVVAGPPCQGFSTLNRRGGGDARNLLYAEILRCVQVVSPKVVVVENVPRFLQTEKATALAAALRQRGYAVRTGLVNAVNYGVPQKRLRALLSATRCSSTPPWPIVTHDGRSRRHRTVADAFALLPTSPDGCNWHRPYRSGANRERIRAVPEGGSRRDLPADLVLDCWRNTDGFGDVLGRLVWHRPSVTIRTEFFRPEKGRFLHPTEDRPITVREAARLQSFSDGFVFPEDQTLTSVARQIGNAIPPRLAEAIAEALAREIGFSHRAPLQDRSTSLSASASTE